MLWPESSTKASFATGTRRGITLHWNLALPLRSMMFEWNYPSSLFILLLCLIHHCRLHLNTNLKQTFSWWMFTLKFQRKNIFICFLKQFHLNFERILLQKLWKGFINYFLLTTKVKTFRIISSSPANISYSSYHNCGFNFLSLKPSSKWHQSNQLTPRSTCTSELGAPGTSRDSMNTDYQ